MPDFKTWLLSTITPSPARSKMTLPHVCHPRLCSAYLSTLTLSHSHQRSRSASLGHWKSSRDSIERQPRHTDRGVSFPTSPRNAQPLCHSVPLHDWHQVWLSSGTVLITVKILGAVTLARPLPACLRLNRFSCKVIWASHWTCQIEHGVLGKSFFRWAQNALNIGSSPCTALVGSQGYDFIDP